MKKKIDTIGFSKFKKNHFLDDTTNNKLHGLFEQKTTSALDIEKFIAFRAIESAFTQNYSEGCEKF